MKAITTIFLISILNSYQPQSVVLDTTEVAMSEIKKKKKGFFSKFKGAK
tara:strand:- start:371 stop:517 length:147 start_codon:yes stop_codon:yes gene_type:complete